MGREIFEGGVWVGDEYGRMVWSWGVFDLGSSGI
jgi:hypothetical protein